MLKILTLICLVNIVVKAAHLPSYISICTIKDNNFKQCILDNILKNWQSLTANGDKSLKLANLNPVKIKKLQIQASSELRVDFIDMEFAGLNTCKPTDVTFDPTAEDFSIRFNCDFIEVLGHYELNGRILILPIQGNGHVNITIVKPDINVQAKLRTTTKGGTEYYDIDPTEMELVPERVYYYLENLFNGDKRLGDEMNIFLNENWKEVFSEIGQGVTTSISIIVKIVTNAFFNNIPANEIHH